MNQFASRPRTAAPAVAPHWLFVRRVLVFALLIALTAGPKAIRPALDASFPGEELEWTVRG